MQKIKAFADSELVIEPNDANVGAETLFVFSMDVLKQNAGSLLTPVSYTVCYAL